MHSIELSDFLKDIRTNNGKSIGDIISKPDKLYLFTSELGFSLLQEKLEYVEPSYHAYQWLINGVLLSDIQKHKKEKLKSQQNRVIRKYEDNHFVLDYENENVDSFEISE